MNKDIYYIEYKASNREMKNDNGIFAIYKVNGNNVETVFYYYFGIPIIVNNFEDLKRRLEYYPSKKLTIAEYIALKLTL